MNTKRRLFAALVVVAYCAPATLAWSQEGPAPGNALRGEMNGPTGRSLSIGADPMAEMTRGLPGFDLQLVLSEGNHHAPAAGVRVVITDVLGREVTAIDDADPLIVLDLPDGRYRVVVDFGHVKRLGSVDVVKNELASLHLHGPERGA